MNIQEDFVSFETAKLLKEKGFDDEYTNAFYDKTGDLYFIDLLSDFSEHMDNDTDVAASTLYVAMKWLREVHKIHIQIWILEEKGYWLNIEKILNAQYKHKSLYSTGLEDIYFDTYEEACEAAIKYYLEHLI